EPVRPRPSTSRPDSAAGGVASWMGVGVTMPASVRTVSREEGTPRSAKERDKEKAPYIDRRLARRARGNDAALLTVLRPIRDSGEVDWPLGPRQAWCGPTGYTLRPTGPMARTDVTD